MEAVCSLTPPAGCMTMIAGDFEGRLLGVLGWGVGGEGFVALYRRPASRMEPGGGVLMIECVGTSPIRF